MCKQKKCGLEKQGEFQANINVIKKQKKHTVECRNPNVRIMPKTEQLQVQFPDVLISGRSV